MKMAAKLFQTVVLFVTLCLISISSSHHEEDFAFDQEIIPQSEIARISSRTPLRRQFGIPDAMAYLGRLFFFKIPPDAFSGTLSHYKVSGMPSWMIFKEGEGLFEGVPGDKDVGETYITVIAIGPTAEDSVKDIFVVEVSPDPREYGSDIKERCKSGQDATTITVLLDKDFYSIKPADKILAVKNLAGFLSLNHDKFSLLPQNSEDDILSENVINAGPGNVKKKSSLTSTSLQWQVGCGGSVWSMHGITHVKQIAKDGTLAEVIQLPVIGWHLATSPFPFRARRELVGSGEGEEREAKEDETENADDDEEEEEPEKRVTVPMRSPTPVLPEHMKTTDAHHPLRHAHNSNHHHHGENGEEAEEEGDDGLSGKLVHNTTSGDPVVSLNILPTPTLVPERPIQKATEYPSYSSQITPDQVTRFYTTETSAVPEAFSPPPEYTDGDTEPLGEDQLQTSTIYMMDNSSSTVTPFLTNTPTDVTKAIDYTKETDVEEPKNFPPRISERLPQLAVTAGKLLQYTIPDNTFSDLEDGNTRELSIDFLTNEKNPLERSSWIQFNPQSLTIYALPLEEHVSKWYFTIKATDSEGESVSDEVVVAVQNHRQQRTITHEITIHFQPWLDEKVDKMLPLDLHILILNRLVKLYNNTDSSHITVLSMNSTSFSWTNDSLSRISPCPRQEIQNLIKVLTESDDQPRSAVKSLFLPELDVLHVTWTGRGQCQRTDKEMPEPPPQTVNFSPTRRNSIDLLNATVGELLVYTVPGDSYYDHEDGSVRNLKLTLLTANRSAIPYSHWLQFDVKNQEFYGIPNPNDTGRTQYQLVCEDSGGLSFNDGLIVEVHPARKILYNVEFSMTLGIHYDNFVMSPASQRHFFEKLAELFGDKDTSAIVRSGMSPGSTVVTWHNRTLPTNICPNDQIKVLRQVLLGDDERVSMRAKTIMGPELNVLTASLTPTRLCEGASTPVHIPEPPAAPPDEVRPVSRSDEYLVTVVVPAVVIATMLICAALVACILYRRRRTGKMSVGDEDERQSFRSKGIPVIFQDELEERPEPTNKSPVIMKEEKPPLPPPEYQRSSHPTVATALLSDTEDSPYQPPPPFTSSRDSARPKPPPTYRMPPPYVPP
ncbi:hypothetical protein LSTR_LSTR000803 [Laodelphax striatellus]|uniref:Dystroglycan 1 n=1 Tax=Laodelphax striatellus TaxID=195883 RepID=A0A482XHQ6_LAOST|nr:hypothetical protein LSTR_LSTR000803 [Laodelphax striatellus]